MHARVNQRTGLTTSLSTWLPLLVGTLLMLESADPVWAQGTAAIPPRQPSGAGDSLPLFELKPRGAMPAKGQGAQPDELDLELMEDEDDSAAPGPEPDPGTPEWLLREISILQSAPLDAVKVPVPGKPGEFQVRKLTDDEIELEEKRRAALIAEKALEICAKTRGNKLKASLFNNAVHYLATSRVTLAAYGDHDQVRLLSEEADTLFKVDPTSFAAMEVHLKLIECLQELAEQEGRKKPEWGLVASRQARLFASRFPKESTRSGMALVSAARACEVVGSFDEARRCFELLEREFPKTPFVEHSAGSLRRYRMVGSSIGEFSGSTIDGGHLSLDQLRGKPVLIVFWSAESPSFREDLPRLRQLVAAASDRSLQVVGVNMDLDESLVDSFLEKANLTWRTMFNENLDERGVKSPIAKAFGVSTVPQYWLISPNGVVLAAPVDLKGLEAALTKP